MVPWSWIDRTGQHGRPRCEPAGWAGWDGQARDPYLGKVACAGEVAQLRIGALSGPAPLGATRKQMYKPLSACGVVLRTLAFRRATDLHCGYGR